jgi:hypothetical protein
MMASFQDCLVQRDNNAGDVDAEVEVVAGNYDSLIVHPWRFTRTHLSEI